MVVKLAKAAPVGKTLTVVDTVIMIDSEITEFGPTWLGDAADFYEDQAAMLVDALIQSLPGGTLDRVLIRLMEHKASLFRVPL